jgi:DNA-binding NarL/FixJ family response regulator
MRLSSTMSVDTDPTRLCVRARRANRSAVRGGLDLARGSRMCETGSGPCRGTDRLGRQVSSGEDGKLTTDFGPGRARAALVGRDAELGSARALADGLFAGRGAVLWIDGEAGIGKTSLVENLSARCAEAGAVCLQAGGDELMEAFPLRLMAACLGVSGHAQDRPRREIAALLRGEAGAGRAADPIPAAAERMLDLVDRLCARGPLVLVADDLQWSDEASLQVWGRLARATDQIPLLLVGVTRPAPFRRPVERLREAARAGGGAVLELRPLADGEAARLAGQIAGGAPGPRLRAELGRAGGNPLYVRALVDALRGAGLIAARSGEVEFTGAPGAVPDSLSQAIGRWLGFLSPGSVKTLRFAALLGAEFDPAQLAAVAELSPARVAETMAEAVDAGVVIGGERLSFRHAVIQQVLVQQTPLALRRTLHGHIARTLADAEASPDAIARHLIAMSDELDSWAVDWLAAAPQAALYGAPAVSADLLERALRAVREGDDERWEPLSTRLANVLFLRGRDEQVVKTAVEVVRRTRDVERAAQMATLVVRSAGRLGRIRLAAGIAEQALAAEGLALSSRARLRAWFSMAQFASGRLPEAQAQAAQALEEARRSGDPLSIAYAHHTGRVFLSTEDKITYIDQALALLGPDAESTELRALMTHNLLVWLDDLGRVQEYGRVLPEALVMAEKAGTAQAHGILAVAADTAFLRGQWDEALIHLGGDDPEYLAMTNKVYLHGLAALIESHRGERERAAAHLAVIDEVLPDGPLEYDVNLCYMYEARAVLAETAGDAPGALALTATWLRMPPGYHSDARSDEAPYLVRLALQAGDRETALAATRAAEERADADRLFARRTATARCCRGQLEDDAAELLAAAEACEHGGWPFPQAFALEEAAVRLAEQGENVRARAALTDAARLYTRLGAVWDVRRADSRLRRRGVRRGSRSTHRLERTGWAALTASELRIAQLVGQRLSNPDIAAELYLSRRTVQTHVSNILAKLEMHSRIEVIRAVDRHEMSQLADTRWPHGSRSSR